MEIVNIKNGTVQPNFLVENFGKKATARLAWYDGFACYIVRAEGGWLYIQLLGNSSWGIVHPDREYLIEW